MCFSIMVSHEYRGRVGLCWLIAMIVSVDAVGGEMLDFMLGRLNEFARIVMCGAISDYSKSVRLPPRSAFLLIRRIMCRLRPAVPDPKLPSLDFHQGDDARIHRLPIRGPI